MAGKKSIVLPDGTVRRLPPRNSQGETRAEDLQKRLKNDGSYIPTRNSPAGRQITIPYSDTASSASGNKGAGYTPAPQPRRDRQTTVPYSDLGARPQKRNDRRTPAMVRTSVQAGGLKKKMGKKPDPKGKIARSQKTAAYTPPVNNEPNINKGQRPQTPKQKRPAPSNKTTWAVPEGSPIYTANGVYINGAKPPEIKKEKRFDIPITPEEIRYKKRKNSSAFFKRLLAGFVLAVLALASFFYFNFIGLPVLSEDISYYYLYGEAQSQTLSSASAYRNGIEYINFSMLFETLGLTNVGSVDSMRFIITDGTEEGCEGNGDEEYVIFERDSCRAVLNGASVIMSGPCYTVDEYFYVPISFVKNYISGLKIKRGENSVTFTCKNEKEIDDGVYYIPPIKFRLCMQQPAESNAYPE